MKKTDTFFIIDNFNHDPSLIVEYSNNYIIYDASTNESFTNVIKEKGFNYKKVKRTGHNISSYFDFFIENYDKLPDYMCLTKGHMIGRHCTKEYFDRVYDNKFFTYLYSQQEGEHTKLPVSSMLMENMYIEKNDSWYVNSASHPHKYFDNLNRLLNFIYKNPVLPEYTVFAPGGCYIVTKEQVLKNPKNLYKILNEITTYELNPNFPSEAHMLERILPILFSSNYNLKDYIFEGGEYESVLEKEIEITHKNDEQKKKIIYKLKRKLGFVL